MPIIPYDPPPIFVQITAPPGDIDLTGFTNIIGTVTNDYLFFWDLRYFRVGRHGRGWVTFASGTDAVTNGFLGTFDPTLLPNGIYKVKLVAVDFVGNATETEPLLLKVGEGPKVGHFTLAFTDLEIPVAGLPITLTRSYDSRATEPGDFGAGWKLDVSSVNLQKSGVLGIGWQTETASFNVCVTDDADPHSIAVNFPDKTYRFGTRLRLNYRDTPCRWRTA